MSLLAFRPNKAATRRRSQRILLSITISVEGQTSAGQTFTGTTKTSVVNAHGAAILLQHAVSLGASLKITNLKTAETMLSACANCGTQVVRGGGPLVPGSPTIPFRVVAHDLESTLASGATNASPAPPPVLTDIIGIGKARAEKLQEAGINTVEELAAASPESVAHALRGVSLENAAVLVEHAKRNLVSHN